MYRLIEHHGDFFVGELGIDRWRRRFALLLFLSGGGRFCQFELEMRQLTYTQVRASFAPIPLLHPAILFQVIHAPAPLLLQNSIPRRS